MEYFHSQEIVSNASLSNIYQGQSSLMEILKVGNSNIPVTKSTAETTTKSMAACKNHSEAERRRRKRINGHLSTLRSLLPNTIKTDKASLLAEVVQRVKELKETTSELAAAAASTSNGCTRNQDNNNYVNTSDNYHDHDEYMIIPSETDELDLFYCDQHYGTIKAVICCEDRPELMSDITSALSSVQAKVVRAEMATIGGRTKIVLWLLRGSLDRDEGLTATRRALVVVLLSESGQDMSRGKRIRRSCVS